MDVTVEDDGDLSINMYLNKPSEHRVKAKRIGSHTVCLDHNGAQLNAIQPNVLPTTLPGYFVGGDIKNSSPKESSYNHTRDFSYLTRDRTSVSSQSGGGSSSDFLPNTPDGHSDHALSRNIKNGSAHPHCRLRIKQENTARQLRVSPGTLPIPATSYILFFGEHFAPQPQPNSLPSTVLGTPLDKGGTLLMRVQGPTVSAGYGDKGLGYKGGKQGSFFCPSCNRSFTRASSVDRHIGQVHEGARVTCSLCNRKVSGRTDAVDRHKRGGRCVKGEGYPAEVAGPPQ